MSYTTMMVIQSDGSTQDIAKFGNAHAWSPRIWGPICKRFLGNSYAWLHDEDSERLWALWRDERMPVAWRIALACTFDHAIVSASSAREVASMLRQFDQETSREGYYASHLAAVADRLDSLPPCLGACFHGTSVTNNLWRFYDEESDSMKAYNLATGQDHFFVLESIAASRMVATAN